MNHLHSPAPDGDYDFFASPPTAPSTPTSSSAAPSFAPGAPSRFGGPPDGPAASPGAPASGGFAAPGFGGAGPGGLATATPAPPAGRRRGTPAWVKVLVPVLAVLVVAAGVLLVPPFVKGFRAQQTFDATSVATPPTAAGYTLDTSPQGAALAAQMTEHAPTGSGGSAAGVYVDRTTRQIVIVAAAKADEPRLDLADRDIADAVGGLRSGGLEVTGLTPIDPGGLGGRLECGAALMQRSPVRVCVSADVAVATFLLFSDPKTPDTTVVAMREAIEVR